MNLDKFIDEEMINSPLAHSVIYIYAYKKYTDTGRVTMNEINKNVINLVENDIINALNYWKKRGLLDFEIVSGDINIIFNENINESIKENTVSEVEEVPQNNIEVIEETPIFSPNIIIDQKPNYSPEEIEYYRGLDDGVKRLYALAETAFGSYLTSTEIVGLFSFYDWLKLPIDVIEILIIHCCENGNDNIRYMEKVALDWHKKGLNTPEKVNDYLKKYSSNYRGVLKDLGITGRDVTEIEIDIISKWYDELGFDSAMIKEACELAILNADKPSIKYVDGILRNWQKAGVKTKEDAAAEAERFYLNKNKNKSTTTAKTTKFNNFSQDTTDLNKIMEMEKKRLKDSLS